MNFFIDEEDEESPAEKAARAQEREQLRQLGNGRGKNLGDKISWDIMTTGMSLYKLFESCGIVHATPKQLKSHEKRKIGIIS